MKKENVIFAILYLAIAATIFFYFERKHKVKEYIDYLSNLGYSKSTLQRLSANEVETMYKYVHDFTQKGIPIYFGHPLYNKITSLESKFPQLFPNGLNEK